MQAFLCTCSLKEEVDGKDQRKKLTVKLRSCLVMQLYVMLKAGMRRYIILEMISIPLDNSVLSLHRRCLQGELAKHSFFLFV